MRGDARRLRVLLGLALSAVACQAGLAQEPDGRRGMIAPHPQPPSPFHDEVHGAVSDDGLAFRVLPGPFFQQASVPDIVELTRESPVGSPGTLLVYFVDFREMRRPGTEGISVASSRDGERWSDPRRVSIAKKVNQGAAVDPSIVQLNDGRLRMYFFGSETTRSDPASVPGDHVIYSAVSEDGVHFEVEPGVRFGAPRITDPEVLQVGSEWWMFLSRGHETLLARSTDGLTFIPDETFTLSIGGVPGAVVLEDGRVRVFASGHEGIVSATVDPEPRAVPTPDPGVRVSRGNARVVADPACVRRRDGSYYLIVKKQPRQEPELEFEPRFRPRRGGKP